MLKKIVITLIFVLAATNMFAQDQQEGFKVGYWVMVNDVDYRQRVVNEIASGLENSNEWNFIPELNEWDSDIHLIISGMPDSGSGYAWSFTFTPIFEPHYTNGNVAISENSITGMNWASRKAVKFIEEQLYIILDDMNDGNT